MTSYCAYWDCRRPIHPDHFLCMEHYHDLQDGLIDECPRCGRFKDAEYELCLDCRRGRPVKRARLVRQVNNRQPDSKPEHSQVWQRKDATAEQFFVYILLLSDRKFYVGQTRELRERLSEHKDGKERATKGRDPKLVYFEVHPTREAAASREVELKKLNDSNEREIRHMVINFKDWVRELELD